MTTAMLGQLTYRWQILDPSNDRYRLQNRSETAKKTKNKATTNTKSQLTVHN
jgi:hypothetical protein